MTTTIALVPAISLAGSALAADWLAALIDLKIESVYQAPSRATVRFVDPAYALTAAATATPGAAIDITDPTDTSVKLFSGEITSVGVEQRLGEQPELVIVAHDKSHRLGRQTVARSFNKASYSDIVSQLAQDAGLSAQTDSTSETYPYLMQSDSDLGLVTELARRVGYDWWVEGSNLHFAKPVAGATVNLQLGGGLLSFSARASAQAPNEVQLAGWDNVAQQVVNGQATTSSSAVAASSDVADLAQQGSTAFGSATMFSAGLGVLSTGEANQLSGALLDRFAAASVRASGVAAGNGAIKLGAVANVSDAGPLSGTYPVTRVEHVYRARSGYITRFWSGDRQPTTLVDSLGGGVTKSTLNATGLTVGVVTNINDPDSTGKVQVLYPGLGDQYATGWARVAAPGGGTSRGGVFTPEVNDEVLIGFECADSRRPVVIGGLYGSKSTIPPPSIQDGKVQQRAITSRLGHIISLSDGTDTSAQSIDMVLAGSQHKVHLGKDNLTISVPQGLAVTISAGDTTQVAFDTQGNVTVKGGQITLQATEKVAISAPQIQISADAQLQLAGDAEVTVQGGMISVNGDSQVSIAGALVQIN